MGLTCQQGIEEVIPKSFLILPPGKLKRVAQRFFASYSEASAVEAAAIRRALAG